MAQKSGRVKFLTNFMSEQYPLHISATFELLFEEAVWTNSGEWLDYLCKLHLFAKGCLNTWWESAGTVCPYLLFIIDTQLISSQGMWRWGKWDGRLRSGSTKVSNFIQFFFWAHFTLFALSTRRSPPWNHDILNFLSQTWSRGGERLPGDNFCLQPKCSLPWTRIPSGEEAKVVVKQLSVDVIWILVN